MLKRTKNHDEINSVLKHPFIWPRIAPENTSIDEFVADISDSDHHLFDEGVLFNLHHVNGEIVIHANVLPEFRHKAEKAAKEALIYGFEEMGAEKIIAKIPERFGSVYGFALKFMEDKGLIDGIHHLEARPDQ